MRFAYFCGLLCTREVRVQESRLGLPFTAGSDATRDCYCGTSLPCASNGRLIRHGVMELPSHHLCPLTPFVKMTVYTSRHLLCLLCSCAMASCGLESSSCSSVLIHM